MSTADIIDAIGKNDDAQKFKIEQPYINTESASDYFDKCVKGVVSELSKPQDKIEFENKQFLKGSKRGREDMKRECIGKLKEAWVNTNGKYDVNKAIAVIEAVEV